MITPLTRSIAVQTAPRESVLRQDARRKSAQRRDESNSRQGGAAVEVALCLPVLLLVTLLFIEFTNSIFLQQSLKAASYEGVRVAIKQGATISDVTEICASILDGREVVEYEISVEPTDFSIMQRGTLTTVTIEVDKAQNRLFGMLLGSNDTIEIESFGLKE